MQDSSFTATDTTDITITLPSPTDTITLGPVNISNFGSSDVMFWHNDEEWVDKLPDLSKVDEMCLHYPGLQIAFEKFKTVYKLVHDDFNTKKESGEL